MSSNTLSFGAVWFLIFTVGTKCSFTTNPPQSESDLGWDLVWFSSEVNKKKLYIVNDLKKHWVYPGVEETLCPKVGNFSNPWHVTLNELQSHHSLHVRGPFYLVCVCVTFATGMCVLLSAPSTYRNRSLVRLHIWKKEACDQKQEAVITRGFRMARWTVPAGTDFRRSTVSDRVSWSTGVWLTDTSWSPGSKPPWHSAELPGTSDRITITHRPASIGSWWDTTHHVVTQTLNCYS